MYKVGYSDGWIPKDDHTYYDWWAEDKEFHVGDSLVFAYDHNFNDVIQVSGALEYEFCDSSSPKAVYKTGHDIVTLTEPGYHYFINPKDDGCPFGRQKLKVLVVHDPSCPIPPPPPSIIDAGGVEKAKEVDSVLEISSDLEFKSWDRTSPIVVHKMEYDLVRGVHYFIAQRLVSGSPGLSIELWLHQYPMFRSCHL
ncbi:unnamed protein product [Arabis nemorensis]|uniref:Phytocyanin domain-containing protein n=1 Tax=Arabis nemorensis TaxID=586526 RepID=A0A565AR11_9BRAS|nr:unnamed protein product [Arabis nemorensis]